MFCEILKMVGLFTLSLTVNSKESLYSAETFLNIHQLASQHEEVFCLPRVGQNMLWNICQHQNNDGNRRKNMCSKQYNFPKRSYHKMGLREMSP